MKRFFKLKPPKREFAGRILIITVFLSLSMMGCGRTDAAQLEHEASSMESGLMEVSVCAQTEDQLLIPLRRRVVSGEDAAISAMKLLCATPENTTLLSGYGLSAPLSEGLRLANTVAAGCMYVTIEQKDSSDITPSDSVMRAIGSTALALPDINQVEITHQGQVIAHYTEDNAADVSASPALNPLPLPVLSSGNSLNAFTLYYPLSQSDFLVPLTAYLPTEPTAVTLTEALLKTEPPEGLNNPFPADALLLFAEQTEDGLLLEFSEEIIPFALEQREDFDSALSSLWHTLKTTAPVKSLILSSGGHTFYTYVGEAANQIP